MSDNIPYAEQERMLADALKYKAKHPKASFRYLQTQFKVHKDWIHRRYNEQQASQSDQSTPSNTRLSPEQDKALCYFLNYLTGFGIPLVYQKIASAANHILQINDADSDVIGLDWSWIGDSIQSNPELGHFLIWSSDCLARFSSGAKRLIQLERSNPIQNGLQSNNITAPARRHISIRRIG